MKVDEPRATRLHEVTNRQERLLEAQPLIPGAQPTLMFKVVESSTSSESSCGTSRPALTGKTAHALKIREPHVITVTGKAYYDIGHAPADHSNRRRTPKDYAVWEIHPVMKMEVTP